MRLRGSGDALLILFAYLETVPLYNSRFPAPLPDTLPLLPCGAGGFAGGAGRRGRPCRVPVAGRNCHRVVCPVALRCVLEALVRSFDARKGPLRRVSRFCAICR